MKLELAKVIVEVCEVEGFEAEVYEDYSGRMMYGEKTTGVTVEDLGGLMTALINNTDILQRHCVEHGQSDRSEFRMDSLGFDTIIY